MQSAPRRFVVVGLRRVMTYILVQEILDAGLMKQMISVFSSPQTLPGSGWSATYYRSL
jgi:hypothetical protein